MKALAFTLFSVSLLLVSRNYSLAQQKPAVKFQTAVAYYNRGLAEFGYGDVDAALENMNKAISLKADYADALSYRGYFHKLKNELDAAIADYQKADALKPNVNGYFMAVPYALKGQKDEAFKYLELSLYGPDNKPLIATLIDDADLKTLQDDPRWKTLIEKPWYSAYEKLVNEGNDKMNAGEFAEAITIYGKAIKADMTSDAAYGQRALAYYRLGDMKSAEIDLTMAINLKPLSVYYGNRAYMRKEQQKSKEALEDYNKAIELDPQNMVYADRAMVKEGMDYYDATVAEDLQFYLDAFYKDDYYAFILGSNYFINGKYNSAVTYLSQAIGYKAEAEYYKLRGKAYFAMKTENKSLVQNAIDDFNSCINMKPSDGEAFYFRGMSKAEQLDKTGACSDWYKAQNLGYKDPNGYIEAICN